MTQPIKTDTWLVEGTTGFNSLHLRREVTIPALGDHDCLVQIQAVSLNYRDLIITKEFPTSSIPPTNPPYIEQPCISTLRSPHANILHTKTGSLPIPHDPPTSAVL